MTLWNILTLAHDLDKKQFVGSQKKRENIPIRKKIRNGRTRTGRQKWRNQECYLDPTKFK